MATKIFNEDPEQLKPLIHGENRGEPLPITTDQNGALNVVINDLNGQSQNWPTTAFKELRVAQLYAVAGWTFNYNVNSDIVNSYTDGSYGTITVKDSKAVLKTGPKTSGYAKIETIKPLRYCPGIGALVRFSAIFTSGVVGNTQIIGVGDDTDGLFFGYNGEDFGVLRRQNGTDNWITQANWNGDKFDGSGESGITLDQTKGNVYYINYQWLGYGYISFGIENPLNGELIIAHSLQYANTSDRPHIYNPTLPLMAETKNTTSNNIMILETSSAMGFVEGIQTDAIVTRNSISTSKLALSSKIAMLTIRNKATYQTKTNRVRIKLDFLSVSADGAKTVEVKLIRNATLGGTSSWTDIGTNTSVIEYDTSATTVTGGTEVMVYEIGKTDTSYFYIGELDLILSPDNTYTISAQSTSTTDLAISLSWKELF